MFSSKLIVINQCTLRLKSVNNFLRFVLKAQAKGKTRIFVIGSTFNQVLKPSQAKPN